MPRLICLKCGGPLERLPDRDAVRCHKCKRLWDSLELHRAKITGTMDVHGVGEEDPSDATGHPGEYDDL